VSAPVLTRLLALEAPARQPDGGGGATEGWATLGSHWAEVLPRRGAEALRDGLQASDVTHRIRVRWAPFGAPSRPVASQRFREGARIFDILAVTEADTDSAFLLIWAREGLAR